MRAIVGPDLLDRNKFAANSGKIGRLYAASRSLGRTRKVPIRPTLIFPGSPEMTEVNPYAPAKEVSPTKAEVFDGGRRIRGGFLYREIQIETEPPLYFIYSGWWFVQRVTVNGIGCWSKISWLNLDRQIRFALPKSVDSQQRLIEIEIQFGPSLAIKGFNIWYQGDPIYTERTA